MEEPHPLEGQLVIGIDLGTTNSAVAVWDERAARPTPISGPDGRFLLPSVVGWDAEAGSWLVGEPAQALGIVRPQSVAYSIKRFIGRSFSDPEVRSGRKDLTYQLLPGTDPDGREELAVQFGTDEHGAPIRLAAPEISAKVLAALRSRAAVALGVPLKSLRHAVITVPAYFNMPQRIATKRAGELAGFAATEILNEPTAAALVAAADLLSPEPRQILVYDLGGGTFDISLVEAVRDDVGYQFDTRVVDGHTRLGGDDIDTSVVHWLATQLQERHGHTVRSDDHVAREALRRWAEQAKIRLSTQPSYTIDLSEMVLDGGSADQRVELTRAQLEACTAEVVERTQAIVKEAVEEVAQLTWDEIDDVILVGGQTLMPAIARSVEELAGRAPRMSEQPQLAVALGAAEYAHMLSIGRKRFHERALYNVLAQALGIQLDDNTFQPLVEANRTIPTRSLPFSVTTIEDNQTRIEVKVLQGPRHATRADECVSLGTLVMEVPAAEKGTPRFEVVFDVHEDGTMKVIVHDTGRERIETREIFPSLAWHDKRESEEEDHGS
jgi:molecular chaperone DnaK